MIISKKSVSRLPLYRSALLRIKTYGTSRIFSCDIAKVVGFSAAQVRKDFSQFKLKGKKKVGYDVKLLLKNIDLMLRKNEETRAVVCGTEANGTAFFVDQLLASPGLSVAAIFDDSQVVPGAGAVRGIPVLPLNQLVRFVTENRIRYGIIASNKSKAQRVVDMLVLSGIQGVLNLTGAEIKAPKRCVAATISVEREFDKLVYFVNNMPAQGKTGGVAP